MCFHVGFSFGCGSKSAQEDVSRDHCENCVEVCCGKVFAHKVY